VGYLCPCTRGGKINYFIFQQFGSVIEFFDQKNFNFSRRYRHNGLMKEQEEEKKKNKFFFKQN
jgi:hypothetical protein